MDLIQYLRDCTQQTAVTFRPAQPQTYADVLLNSRYRYPMSANFYTISTNNNLPPAASPAGRCEVQRSCFLPPHAEGHVKPGVGSYGQMLRRLHSY